MTKKIRLYQPFGDLGCQRPEMPHYSGEISTIVIRIFRSVLAAIIINSRFLLVCMCRARFFYDNTLIRILP